MQIAGVGADFDYVKQRRRSWLYCTLTLMMGIILTVVMDATYTFHQKKRSDVAFEIYASYIPQNGSLLQIVVSFAILLHGLHERFAALNSFLRLVFF